MSGQLSLRAIILAFSALLILPMVFVAEARAVATPGIVEVDGYSWSKSAKVDLNELGGGTDETVDGNQVKAFTLLEILEEAETQTSDLDVATLKKITIAYPRGIGKKPGNLSYSGNQVRNPTSNQARFFVDANGSTNLIVPGQPEPVVFKNANPKLLDPTQFSQLDVDLKPASKDIKTGDKVSFTAKVTGASGATLEYSWDFGDGNRKTTDSGRIDHVFKGTDRQFFVTLTVSAPGFRDGTGSTVLTIGKVPKKKKEKKDPAGDSNPGGTIPGDSYPYDYYDPGTGSPGYPGGTGYPEGTGNGDTSGPSNSSPAPQQEQPQVPVDDGLTEITGELVSSTAPAATVSPGEAGSAAPATETEPETSGFGVPREAWTVLGLLALLGLGVFVERRGARLQ